MYPKKNLPSSLKRVLWTGSLVLIAGLAACHRSGGRAKTPGLVGPPAGPQLAVDFGLRRDLVSGARFTGDALVIDLNGDGVSDLVQSHYLPSQISLLLGSVDGSFVPYLTLPTSGFAFRLASGDFDGDGLEDLAVANQEYGGAGASVIDVFLQGPTPGEFSTPAISRALGQDPIDLASAPQSGITGAPGPDELFVCIREEFRVARMSVIGGGLLETGSLDSSVLGTAGGAYSIAVIDLGADGALDLVVGEDQIPGAADRVVHYARNGTDFTEAQLVMAPLAGPIVDNAGDINGDGYDDIAVAQFRANVVYLLVGDAAGLSMAVPIDFGGRTTSLIFPDLDGDGFAEAIATVFEQGSVQVLPGAGEFVWGDPVHYSVGTVSRAIDTILLPGDDLPDLLCGNAHDLSVMVGIGGGAFRAARGYDAGVDNPNAIELADLDNDGFLDAVTIARMQGSISFHKGDGQGGLAVQSVLPLMPNPDEEPGYIAVADMDADGDLDVLTSVHMLDEVRFYENHGSIDMFQDPPVSDVIATEGGPLGIGIGDMNGDTMPDVVVANRTAGTIQVLLNVGGGELDAQPGTVVGLAPGGVLVTDLDGDGDMDVAAFGEDVSGFHVLILEGDGTGALTLDESHQIDGPSDSMVSGDFNGDDRPDIVVGQTEIAGSELFVLMNQGGLSFDARRETAGDGPGSVMVSDLDGDENLDIAVATTNGEFLVLHGDGNGGFPERSPGADGELPIAQYTLGARLEDMDGDLLPDLVHVSVAEPFIWIGINTSKPLVTP